MGKSGLVPFFDNGSKSCQRPRKKKIVEEIGTDRDSYIQFYGTAHVFLGRELGGFLERGGQPTSAPTAEISLSV